MLSAKPSFSVEPFFDQTTRVTLDIVPMGPNICELVLTHDLGDSDEARANEQRTRQGWANMLQQLDKVLTARSWGGLGFKGSGSA